MTFQSTLPHGSDDDKYGHRILHKHFNPRSLTGATLFDENYVVMEYISIHAPSRERRLLFDHFQAMCGISIHAPSRERLYIAMRHNKTLSISIHAPSRERPSQPYLSNSTHQKFQSTLPHGSDSIKTKYFYIHLNQAFIANQLNSNP